MELFVHETPDAAAQSASKRIADLISAAQGRFSLGLAGGSAAEATYRMLRGRASGWGKVDAWLSDERWVAPVHERSNGRMAATTLLDHVDANFIRPRWSEYMEPEDAAAHYEASLRSIHIDRPPDLIMLGMGADAHIASLFPGTPALAEDRRWYVANRPPGNGEDRITVTYPLLWRARLLLVVTLGTEKAAALKASFENSTPAGQLEKAEGVVEWYVDQDAASLLS
ncbi:MAG TPA: 6-phosphogluconolactonase [Acidimicrobiia bacterium]|nr:6-phosphogluconolactonase [Acidimicrobiia bacterium]